MNADWKSICDRFQALPSRTKTRYVLAGVGALLALIAFAAARGPDDAAPSDSEGSAGASMKVEVEHRVAVDVPREIVLRGQSVPLRAVELRAETAGRVREILKLRGERVEEGEPIVRLELADRSAQIKQARALVKQRKTEYEGMLSLESQGFAAQNRVNELRSALELANSELERVENDIDRTTILAPFAGILNDRFVEVGSYVPVNARVATVVDNSPLIVTGYVSQANVGHLSVGQAADIRFATGETASGTIRYVSAQGEEGTRTFRVEAEVANEAGTLRAGISAEIRVHGEKVPAHFVSPANLALDDEGNLGVKSVDENGVVAFHRATIWSSTSEGVWLTGLPREFDLITTGQGFVLAGDHVVAVRSTKVSAGPAGIAERDGGDNTERPEGERSR